MSRSPHVIVCALVLLVACGTSGVDPVSEAPVSSLPSDGAVPATKATATTTPTTTTPTTPSPTKTPGTTPTTAATPTSVAPAATPAPLESEQRIIPVDGDLAEIVFALGVGDRVVATDISATHPSAADALPEIGYQRALAVEPILAFEPTLVLATDIAGPDETLDGLEQVGVDVVMIETESSASGPGAKIRAVADAVGASREGEALAADVDAAIATAAARVDGLVERPRVGVLYVRGDNVQLLLGEGSGVDWLLDAAGAIDIADDLEVVGNAQINAEALLLAAPDVLVIPSRGLQSVGGIDGLLEMPGIAETPAGQERRVLAYDDQFLLGNGPRTGEFLDLLITDLHPGLR